MVREDKRSISLKALTLKAKVEEDDDSTDKSSSKKKK